jgi:hypothetical protein
MSGTNVAANSPQANKLLSVALFAQAVKEPSPLNNLVGNAPTQSMAEGVLRQQSSEHMPIVQVMDLAKTAGDKVTVDAINVVKGRPIMGDRNAEGKGAKMDFASQEIRIDMATVPIDAGGKMSQKRTYHDLVSLATAQLRGLMPRLAWQRCLVQMSGARGVQDGQDWALPLDSDAEFGEMVINALQAPTYNRHYVIDGADLLQGGANLNAIDTADNWKLAHIDRLAALWDEMPTRMSPIRIPGDPVAMDDPIKGVLFLDPLAYDALLNDTTSGYNIREFQKNGLERASYGSLRQHPLFAGSPIFWNGVLVRKISHAIRFNPNTTVKHVTAANRLTATETDVTIANFAATHQVSRAIFMGAQGLAQCLGTNRTSGVPYSLLENTYNFGRSTEMAGEMIGGEAKLRFKLYNADGNLEPTDFGVMVIDSTIKKIAA